MKNLFFIILLTGIGFVSASAQTVQSKQTTALPRHLTSSGAYSEIALRLAELRADMESMRDDYTDQHPKVLENKWTQASLEEDLKTLAQIRETDAGRLTLSLGKMVVRRAELFAEMKAVELQYGEQHQNTKRARKRLDAFSAVLDGIFRQ